MRFPVLLLTAIVLAGPALAQGTQSGAPAAAQQLDKECRDGSVQACTEASVERGPDGPERPGSGRAGARKAEEARHAAPEDGANTAAGANAPPRASGEGGAMPVPGR